MRTFSFAIALLLAVAMRAQAQSVVNDPFPPAHFTSLYVEWDEADGKSTTVQLNDDTIAYSVTLKGKLIDSATVKPSGDDWFDFIQGLNTAKVYNWAPKYEFPGQGDTWTIQLTMDDRNFSSTGNNEYPKQGEESQPNANPASGATVPFQVFWQAVLTLAGKAPTATSAK